MPGHVLHHLLDAQLLHDLLTTAVDGCVLDGAGIALHLLPHAPARDGATTEDLKAV
jgi:hypothetical protein